MFEEKLNELGFSLSEAPKPLAAYIAGQQIDNLIFTSGQVPIKDGKIIYTGKLGKDVSEETGVEAAKLCALNCLSVVKDIAGSLENIEQIVKVTVFVNSAEGFTAQPAIANGASNLLVDVFGEVGKHTRSAVGVNELPANSAVEIEMIVKVK